LLSTGDGETGTPPNLALITYVQVQFKAADTTPFYKKIDDLRIDDRPQWVDGIVGKALDFDGENDFVDCGSDASLDFGTGDFTISAWIKSTGTAASKMIVSKINVSTWVGFALEREVSEIEFYVNGTHGNFTSCPIINDGEWHFIVVMRVGENIYLYVDGEYIQTLNNANYALNVNDANAFKIGKNDYAGINTFFDGLIDEVRIYKRALTEGEIKAIFNNQRGVIRVRKLIRGIAETLNIQESVARRRSMIRIIDETLGISESIAKAKTIIKVIDEALNINEVIVKIQAFAIVKIINETLNIQENVSKFKDVAYRAMIKVGSAVFRMRSSLTAIIRKKVSGMVAMLRKK
jgi:hypothetical protein